MSDDVEYSALKGKEDYDVAQKLWETEMLLEDICKIVNEMTALGLPMEYRFYEWPSSDESWRAP